MAETEKVLHSLWKMWTGFTLGDFAYLMYFQQCQETDSVRWEYIGDKYKVFLKNPMAWYSALDFHSRKQLAKVLDKLSREE